MPKKTPLTPELLALVGRGFILSSRNGRPYLKRYARPRNPDTANQRRARGALARAVAARQSTDPATQARWNEQARGHGRSGYNLFIQEFIARDAAVPD